MHNPYDVVRWLEADLCEYTGAKYACAVSSCSMALRLALKWWCMNWGWEAVNVPRTYPSVANAVKHAGLSVRFTDTEWRGEYQLTPTNVWDSAKRFRCDMFMPGMFQCVSFHAQKQLANPRGGGAILHDDPNAVEFFLRQRHDGRLPGVPTKDDMYDMPDAEHCLMMPGDAADCLMLLSVYARRDPHEDMDSEIDLYPDASRFGEEYTR